MNIILLSGGSGKRLWPLSNDVRSKQFLKLFKDEKGNYESMVQRVYRQITKIDKSANITIATSYSQISAIKNQLGQNVSICDEPCRKDTFPAIVLAAAYLHDILNISENEVITICPVDPYVDDAYFLSIKELCDIAQKGIANISLIGIEPTYPSEKYGYIIPKEKSKLSKVLTFREKPNIKNAKSYLNDGALWNAGIFAFKLTYILKKAQEIIGYSDYKSLYKNYDILEKISFDYAILEKEENINVLKYSGNWRDVGTWNVMSNVMADKTIGKVILDKTCSTTQVVNELDIPILCMGCKDMIVAASVDGIFISDKHQSSYMKPYVSSIDEPSRYAEKSWGSYTVINVNERSLIIKIILKEGHMMKYHCHKDRDEVLTIIEGEGRMVVDGEINYLLPGDTIKLPKRSKHTLIAITNLCAIETQLGENISVTDKESFTLDIKLK